MILDRVLKLYETEPDLLKRRQPSKGNPTASSVGKCLAQQQMLRLPEITRPALRSVRSAWVFEDGDLHGADLKAKVRRAFPGLTGLGEELFYFAVPVTPEQEATLQANIAARRLWGTLIRGFVPPRVRLDEAGKLTARLAPRDHSGTRPRPMGFIVDPGTGVLWAPLYVDHVVKHPDHGLVTLEFKSMSRWAFRRALVGDMDYSYRLQLAVIGEGTGMNTVWFCKAKDTAHLLEIAFLRGQERVRVTLMRTNGTSDTYFVKAPGERPETAAGEAVELREDETWDVGEVYTPWAPDVLEDARRRVLRVLLFEPPADLAQLARAWDREYGPTFTCPTCGGTGTQTAAKGTGEPLKKGPKPCADCEQAGQLPEARLPAFPCGYCPVVEHCWALAEPRLEVTDKPRWTVSRAKYLASGLTFAPAAAGVAGADEPQ